jgi:hypothetical protein
VSTLYNHQRKVVRAGNTPGGPCDATNSDGCWYSVISDQFVDRMADTAASTETIVTGSKIAGAFPADIASENGVFIQYREGTSPTANYYPGTETIATGSGCGGAFPASLSASDNAYRCLREANTGGVVGDEIGAIGYKSSTGSGVNFPKQLDWTGSAWGTPETELATAGAAVESVRVLWDTAADSTLFWIALNTGANIHVYKCTNVDTCT